MKPISIILLFLVVGCAPTTDELIKQAHQTGDWTQVNQRLEAEANRAAERAVRCPAGTIRWCDNSYGDSVCSCVENADAYRMLDTFRR